MPSPLDKTWKDRVTNWRRLTSRARQGTKSILPTSIELNRNNDGHPQAVLSSQVDGTDSSDDPHTQGLSEFVIKDEKPAANDYKNQGVSKRFLITTWRIITHTKVNFCLLIVIPALAMHFHPNGHERYGSVIFVLNALAIIPLAGILTYATESLARRMGDTLGALLNVTFGNAVEFIIFAIAIRANKIRVVQASLIGSILANLLLILGLSFCLGGCRYKEQSYNSQASKTSAALLTISVTSILLPACFYAAWKEKSPLAEKSMVYFSEGTSFMLLGVYGTYMFFQLKTHSHLYVSAPQAQLDEEAQPGWFKEWLDKFDSSSSESSDSSSDSDSDAEGDDTLGRTSRFKRVVWGNRKERKQDYRANPGPMNTNDPPPLNDLSRFLSRVDSNVAPDAINTQAPALAPVDSETAAATVSTRAKKTKKERKQRKREKKQEKKEKKKAKKAAAMVQQQGGVLSELHPMNLSTAPEPEPGRKNSAKPPTAPRVRVSVVDFADRPPHNGAKPPMGRGGQLSRPQSSTRPRLNPRTLSQGLYAEADAPIRRTYTNSTASPRRRSTIFSTDSAQAAANRRSEISSGNIGSTITPVRSHGDSIHPSIAPFVTQNTPEEEDEETMSRTSALLLLAISTGLVSLCAMGLVKSIEAVSGNKGWLPENFVGLIVVPIVGNAAEHFTAIKVALKNKMDLSIGVAIGSSIQIGKSPFPPPFSYLHLPTQSIWGAALLTITSAPPHTSLHPHGLGHGQHHDHVLHAF